MENKPIQEQNINGWNPNIGLCGLVLCYVFNFPQRCFYSYLSKHNASFKNNFLCGAV